jgi:hypothetical protein
MQFSPTLCSSFPLRLNISFSIHFSNILNFCLSICRRLHFIPIQNNSQRYIYIFIEQVIRRKIMKRLVTNITWTSCAHCFFNNQHLICCWFTWAIESCNFSKDLSVICTVRFGHTFCLYKWLIRAEQLLHILSDKFVILDQSARLLMFSCAVCFFWNDETLLYA